MSTKTSFKRIALVAVTALGMGVLSSVSPAKAADVTGTVSPVRYTETAQTRDLVPYSQIAWTASAGGYDTGDTVTVVVTSAPTADAVVELSTLANIGSATDNSWNGAAAGSDSLNLVGVGTMTLGATVAAGATKLGITASKPGRYTGTIKIMDNATTLEVVSFDFTTVGAPASYTVTSNAVTSAPAGTTTHTITLLDGTGKTTQPGAYDSFALTDGTSTGSFADPAVSATDIALGTFDAVYTAPNTGATASTLTFTPAGVLAGLAAKTATVTTVAATTGVPTATIATSNTIVKASTSTSVLNKYTVAPNQTSVTFLVSGLTANSYFSYNLAASAGTFTSVNAASYTAGDTLTAVASATGTYSVVVIAASPTTQTITIDLNGVVADATGQVNADYTYAAAAYAITLTTPAAESLHATSAVLTFTGKIADQFGNALGGANVLATGTNTPATTPATVTATAITAADGTFTVSYPAAAAATTSIATVITAAKSGLSSNPTQATQTAYFTASGLAATLVLTDGDTDASTSTTDNAATRTVVKPVASASAVNLTAGGVAATDNWVSITPQTTLPASIGYSVTATNGIRLFTSTPAGAAIGVANTAAITGTGGTAFFAVPTKSGAGTITVVSGGLTKTYTLTGTLLAAGTAKANLVTLTAVAATPGQYIVKATDIFGNGVVADVTVSLAGPGAFSNGFKNLTVTTQADGSNTFNVVSDGSAATTITATLSSNYEAITAAQAVTLGLVGASSATATASLTSKGGTSEMMSLTLLINSLIKKLNALATLVAKIQKKLGVK